MALQLQWLQHIKLLTQTLDNQDLLLYATQLYAAHIGEHRENPDNLQHHHAQDLVEFVKAFQLQEEWVIKVGDLDEVLGESTRGITRLQAVPNELYVGALLKR